MAMKFYPSILHPADAQGLFGVEIPGINVNGSGPSREAALADAAAMLQEVIDDLASTGETVPAPVQIDDLMDGGGTLVMLAAALPSKTVRIQVTLPDSIVERIDAVATNRSAFLAEGALQKLRGL